MNRQRNDLRWKLEEEGWKFKRLSVLAIVIFNKNIRSLEPAMILFKTLRACLNF